MTVRPPSVTRQRRVQSGRLGCGGGAFGPWLWRHDLPFGGVGAQGRGHYHGNEGFETFSRMRPAFRPAHLPALKVNGPPQGKLTDSMLDLLIK